jgi:hypothetical protein
MSVKKHMARLRRIREQQHRARSLSAERDDLIRQAIELGHTEREVALASGLSPSRVHDIAARQQSAFPS